MSARPKVNVDINCLISLSVFIAWPFMKSNKCTELLPPGCVTPDPGKRQGGRGRSTCVYINLQCKSD